MLGPKVLILFLPLLLMVIAESNEIGPFHRPRPAPYPLRTVFTKPPVDQREQNLNPPHVVHNDKYMETETYRVPLTSLEANVQKVSADSIGVSRQSDKPVEVSRGLQPQTSYDVLVHSSYANNVPADHAKDWKHSNESGEILRGAQPQTSRHILVHSTDVQNLPADHVSDSKQLNKLVEILRESQPQTPRHVLVHSSGVQNIPSDHVSDSKHSNESVKILRGAQPQTSRHILVHSTDVQNLPADHVSDSKQIDELVEILRESQPQTPRHVLVHTSEVQNIPADHVSDSKHSDESVEILRGAQPQRLRHDLVHSADIQNIPADHLNNSKHSDEPVEILRRPHSYTPRHVFVHSVGVQNVPADHDGDLKHSGEVKEILRVPQANIPQHIKEHSIEDIMVSEDLNQDSRNQEKPLKSETPYIVYMDHMQKDTGSNYPASNNQKYSTNSSLETQPHSMHLDRRHQNLGPYHRHKPSRQLGSQLRDFMCPQQNGYFKYNDQCDVYVECKHFIPRAFTCPVGHYFNHQAQWTDYPCEHPSKVECDNKLTPMRTSIGVTTPRPNGQQSGYFCRQPHGYFKLTDQCDQYIECKNYVAIVFACPDGLHFNPLVKWTEYPCDHPSKVQCIPGIDKSPNSSSPSITIPPTPSPTLEPTVRPRPTWRPLPHPTTPPPQQTTRLPPLPSTTIQPPPSTWQPLQPPAFKRPPSPPPPIRPPATKQPLPRPPNNWRPEPQLPITIPPSTTRQPPSPATTPSPPPPTNRQPAPLPPNNRQPAPQQPVIRPPPTIRLPPPPATTPLPPTSTNGQPPQPPPATTAPPPATWRPKPLPNYDLCPKQHAYIKISDKCDQYIECKNHVPLVFKCPAGLHFNPFADWTEYPCVHPSKVHCNGESFISTTSTPPRPTSPRPINQLPGFTCPQPHGYFDHFDQCDEYVECKNHIPFAFACPVGLFFNPFALWTQYPCEHPTKVPCKKESPTIEPKEIPQLALETSLSEEETPMIDIRFPAVEPPSEINSPQAISPVAITARPIVETPRPIIKTGRYPLEFSPLAVKSPPPTVAISRLPVETPQSISIPVPPTLVTSRPILVAEPYNTSVTSMAPRERSPLPLDDYYCEKLNAYYRVASACDAYVECKNGEAVQRFCPVGLFFNPNAQWSDTPCDFPSKVQCMTGIKPVNQNLNIPATLRPNMWPPSTSRPTRQAGEAPRPLNAWTRRLNSWSHNYDNLTPRLTQQSVEALRPTDVESQRSNSRIQKPDAWSLNPDIETPRPTRQSVEAPRPIDVWLQRPDSWTQRPDAWSSKPDVAAPRPTQEIVEALRPTDVGSQRSNSWTQRPDAWPLNPDIATPQPTRQSVEAPRPIDVWSQRPDSWTRRPDAWSSKLDVAALRPTQETVEALRPTDVGSQRSNSRTQRPDAWSLNPDIATTRPTRQSVEAPRPIDVWSQRPVSWTQRPDAWSSKRDVATPRPTQETTEAPRPNMWSQRLNARTSQSNIITSRPSRDSEYSLVTETVVTSKPLFITSRTRPTLPVVRLNPPPIQLFNYTCPDSNGTYAIPSQCDDYVECKNYIAHQRTCPDGLHFNPKANWPEYPCAYPSEVKCENGDFVQEARSTAECPHLNGFFRADSGDCGAYKVCHAGVAVLEHCPPGLVFNFDKDVCDWPINVPGCTQSRELKDFVCPVKPDGENGLILKYRHNRSCQNFVACQNGYPRLLSCDAGLRFDEETESCVEWGLVADCEA